MNYNTDETIVAALLMLDAVVCVILRFALPGMSVTDFVSFIVPELLIGLLALIYLFVKWSRV